MKLKVQEGHILASTALARELASSAGKTRHDLTHLKTASSLE